MFFDIPLVDRNDHGAALAFCQIGDAQILLLERDRGVQQYHHDLGKLDRAQPVRHRQLFQLFLHLGLLAHARRVPDAERHAVPDFVQRDCVAGDPGLRPGQQPVLAQNAVDQRRFPGVRAAHDGDLKRAFFGKGDFLFLFAFHDVDIGFRLETASGELLDHRREHVLQIDHALAMFGRKLDRFAQAQSKSVVIACLAGAALGLVGDNDHAGGLLAQDIGEQLIGRGYANPCVDHEQAGIGHFDRAFGQHAHAALQALVSRLPAPPCQSP